MDNKYPNPPEKRNSSGNNSNNLEPERTRVRGRIPEVQPTIASAGAEIVPVRTSSSAEFLTQAARRQSAAQSSLEALRNRDRGKVPSGGAYSTNYSGGGEAMTRGQRSDSVATLPSDYARRSNGAKALPHHATQFVAPSSPRALARMSPEMNSSLELSQTDGETSSGGRSTMAALGISRPRLSRSPSIPLAALQLPGPPYPPDLLKMLDGEHHTDEICTKFEVGWPMLEHWLSIVGGGGEEGEEGDYGRVVMIYR